MLAAVVGCGNNNNNSSSNGTRRPPPDQARAPETGSRVNLYPMSGPAPAANQPQGYAPTRITAAQYTPDQTSYAPSPTYSATPASYQPLSSTTYSTQPVAYGPNASPRPYSNTTASYSSTPAPFAGGAGSGAFNTPSGYCTFEDVTAYSNPNVPMGDPPVVINNPGGGVMYAGPSARAPLQPDAKPGLSYGTVEGTADIARPIGPTSTPYTSSSYSTTTYPTTAYAPTVQTVPATTTYSTTTAPVVTTSSTYSPTLSSTTTTTTYMTPGQATYVAMPTTTYQTTSSGVTTSSAYPSTTAPMAAVPASYTPGGAASAGQYKLVPALDVPPGKRPNDAAPSQWFEIVRPDNGPIRIGRVSATCVCVGVRVPERQVGAGQRALIEARILTKPPVNNLTYGIYVGVVDPVQTTLDTDITIRY